MTSQGSRRRKRARTLMGRASGDTERCLMMMCLCLSTLPLLERREKWATPFLLYRRFVSLAPLPGGDVGHPPQLKVRELTQTMSSCAIAPNSRPVVSPHRAPRTATTADARPSRIRPWCNGLGKILRARLSRIALLENAREVRHPNSPPYQQRPAFYSRRRSGPAPHNAKDRARICSQKD